MSRKKIRGIIIAVALFYLVIVVLAIVLLKDDHSVLAKQTMAEILFGSKEQDTEQITEQKTESPEDILERWTEKKTEAVPGPIIDPGTESLITESVTEQVTEPITEQVAEPVTEQVTEPVTEQVTEPVTEQVTGPVTEQVTEPVTERTTEPVTEKASEEKPVIYPETGDKYYVFETLNKDKLLLMRASGDKKAKAIGECKPHTRGVVLEMGESWTKVYTNNRAGYCFTEYIEITEVTREEYEEMAETLGVKLGGN